MTVDVIVMLKVDVEVAVTSSVVVVVSSTTVSTCSTGGGQRGLPVTVDVIVE